MTNGYIFLLNKKIDNGYPINLLYIYFLINRNMNEQKNMNEKVDDYYPEKLQRKYYDIWLLFMSHML